MQTMSLKIGMKAQTPFTELTLFTQTWKIKKVIKSKLHAEKCIKPTKSELHNMKVTMLTRSGYSTLYYFPFDMFVAIDRSHLVAFQQKLMVTQAVNDRHKKDDDCFTRQS